MTEELPPRLLVGQAERRRKIDAILAAGGRPGTCLVTGDVRDLGPRWDGKASYGSPSNAGPNTSSRNPSASDKICSAESCCARDRAAERSR